MTFESSNKMATTKEKRAEYMRKYYHSSLERKNKAKTLMKKYVLNNKERIHTIKKKYYDKNQIEIKARKYANDHIKIDNKCGICKSTKNLEKHHWRYDKPDLIATLCRECHGIQHSKRRIT